jgi:hypothetical protein
VGIGDGCQTIAQQRPGLDLARGAAEPAAKGAQRLKIGPKLVASANFGGQFRRIWGGGHATNDPIEFRGNVLAIL